MSEPDERAARIESLRAVCTHPRLDILEVLALAGGELPTAALRRSVRPSARGSLTMNLLALQDARVVVRDDSEGVTTWRSADPDRSFLRWDETDMQDRRTRTVIRDLQRLLDERRDARIERWERARDEGTHDSPWPDPELNADWCISLTQAESEELRVEVREAVERVRRRALERRAAGTTADPEQTMFVTLRQIPVDLARPH